MALNLDQLNELSEEEPTTIHLRETIEQIAANIRDNNFKR
jgi:hypothetical protein